MKLNVNDYYSMRFFITQEQVKEFALITGDINPIHLDFEYAAKTVFGRPIIHGFFGGAIFSKIIGNYFPGEGTIYLSQNLKFTAPMFVDNEYEATVRILEIFPEKNRYKLETVVKDLSQNKPVIEGDALVKVNQKN